MSVVALRKLVAAWVHPDNKPMPASRDALDRAEARLETYLPLSYRDSMLQVGPPSAALALLSAIVDRRLDIPAIGDFFAPEELIENTEGWREAGLPENMVAFAGTGDGDLYCFEVVPETSPVPTDAMVWYFDHEAREIESLDVAFSDWLALYASIPTSPQQPDA